MTFRTRWYYFKRWFIPTFCGLATMLFFHLLFPFGLAVIMDVSAMLFAASIIEDWK